LNKEEDHRHDNSTPHCHQGQHQLAPSPHRLSELSWGLEGRRRTVSVHLPGRHAAGNARRAGSVHEK